MSEFRQVTEAFWVSPQISVTDVEDARKQGFRTIMNNRPEGEVDDQPSGAAISAAAEAAGLAYVAIPISPGGFREDQVNAMVEVLENAEAPVLAYCRSGTRSTLLWSLANASLGTAPSDISAQAEAAGYDVAPVLPLMEMLAARRA